MESAKRLLRISSPSSVSVYSTRGGISANIWRCISPARSSSASLMVRVDELISSILLLRSPKRMPLRSPIRKSSLNAYLRPMICTSPVVEQRHSWLAAPVRSMHPQAFSSGTVKMRSLINRHRASYYLAPHNLLRWHNILHYLGFTQSSDTFHSIKDLLGACVTFFEDKKQSGTGKTRSRHAISAASSANRC